MFFVQTYQFAEPREGHSELLVDFKLAKYPRLHANGYKKQIKILLKVDSHTF